MKPLNLYMLTHVSDPCRFASFELVLSVSSRNIYQITQTAAELSKRALPLFITCSSFTYFLTSTATCQKPLPGSPEGTYRRIQIMVPAYCYHEHLQSY